MEEVSLVGVGKVPEEIGLVGLGVKKAPLVRFRMEF